MKRILLVLAAFGMFAANAQKVDLDRTFFNTKAVRLPDKYLGDEYKTFAVSVTKTRGIEFALTQPLEGKIGVEGWKRVDGKGHLTIQASFEDLIIESNNVVERIDEKKDQSGKVTSRTYWYKAVVVYSFKGFASVVDYKTGKSALLVSMMGRDQKGKYETGEYNSSQAANNFFANNQMELKTTWINNMVDACLAKLNTELANNFGYPVETINDKLWALDQKKSPEYEPYKQALENAKTQLAALNPNSNITPEVKALFASSISYFESLYQKNTVVEDKNQKKLRYAAYYNLATIYFFLDDLENAKKYADLLIKNDYDTSDGEYYIKASDKMKAKFDAAKVNTRHFTFDISTAVAPN